MPVTNFILLHFHSTFYKLLHASATKILGTIFSLFFTMATRAKPNF